MFQIIRESATEVILLKYYGISCNRQYKIGHVGCADYTGKFDNGLLSFLGFHMAFITWHSMKDIKVQETLQKHLGHSSQGKIQTNRH